MKNRDENVELLRIFACFIVVGTHVKLTNYFNADGSLNRSVTFLSSFFGEGVAIFFLILGFFYFRNKEFSKLCLRTIKTVIVPASIYLIIVDLFSEWINGSKTLIGCLAEFNIDFKTLLVGIVSHDSTKFFSGQHLWFCFTYIQCILWFPLLKSIYENNRNALIYAICLGVICLITIDIQKTFKIIEGTIANFSIVPVSVLLVLIGNEIYRKKDNYRSHKIIFFVGIMTYLIAHVVLFLAQSDAFLRGTRQNFAWNSIYSIIAACGIAMAFLSIKIKSRKISKMINYIGNKTFLIYLIHFPIIMKMNSIGVRYIFLNKCKELNQGAIGDLLYTVIYSALIFVVSFIVAVLIDFIVCSVKNIAAIIKMKSNIIEKNSV